MAGISIVNELRPCMVNKKRALFHKWANCEDLIVKFNTFLSDKEMEKLKRLYFDEKIIGNAGDLYTVNNEYGIVEYEDGSVDMVKPTEIRFINNKFLDYVWSGEKGDEE